MNHEKRYGEENCAGGIAGCPGCCHYVFWWHDTGCNVCLSGTMYFLCAVFFWTCGSRLAWAWYGAVTVLTLLLGPDKEAAAVFAVLGYYPILKLSFERTKIGLLLKLMLFNIVILALYCVMIYVLGLQQVVSDYRDLGYVGVAVLLVLGNITFFLVDRLLTVFSKKRIRHGK